MLEMLDESESLVAMVQEGPRIISVVNQKGGVGKTTTTINLGTALAACGKTVLLIDLDPQGNASTGLGIPRAAREQDIYAVICDGLDIGAAVTPTVIPGMSIVPSSVNLSGAEIELVNFERREYRMQEALTGLTESFDYVLIDCPPSLGLLTLNALVASDAVLVPLQCEFYALEGLSHLLNTIKRVKKNLNPRLEIQGVVLTMFDRRNNLSEAVAADVRGHLGDKVYTTVIPRNVRISEAPSHGKPVIVYDMRCPGAQAYIHLASEVMKRERSLAA
ncbi:MAG: ParA family protein [Oceanibaculum nanhaiense]|jgi:chromosome partitioning protein|uniref:ParA family protein n=1 Tax=Oceanibaculum nanhaiense TaxID=1909734 RepID=UPI0025A3ED9E|nr:ParA family protein [Oceanibaculum nanhaiense]MDM7945822.1 ParA family protein [Oceanibaculum nanhaiense]